MLSAVGFTIAAEDIRHFQLGAIHGTVRLEERWRSRLDLQGDRVRQQIEWLDIEHTLLVAMRRYFAVVARLRCQGAAEWYERRCLALADARQRRAAGNAG
jgi:hypothetical protein